MDIALFRSNMSFALSNIAALLNYSAFFAATFLLSLYLQIVTGLSPRTAGLVLVAMPVIQALISPVAGRLSDRREPRVLASAPAGFIAEGLGWTGYFVFCAAAAVPGLVLLRWIAPWRSGGPGQPL